MKKKFRFYALLALLLAAALLFGGSEDGLLQSLGLSDEVIAVIEDSVPSALADSSSGKNDRNDKSGKTDKKDDGEDELDPHGSYDQPEDVALFIHTYGRLPDNYITKKEAEKLGWTGGSVERYAPGKCIGGSRFGNREGILPSAKGRTWTECDINTLGKSSRGAERIVFSNDGLIYYTDDHYVSFILLYGEP